MNDISRKIRIFAHHFLHGDGRHNMLRKRYGLISKLMNLDNSSEKNYGISTAFSPCVWLYTIMYILTRGVEPLFILILGCREPINWKINGYAPFFT